MGVVGSHLREKAHKSGGIARALVQDIYKANGGSAAFCVVYTGNLSSGERVWAEPSGTAFIISSVDAAAGSGRLTHAAANLSLRFEGDKMPSRGEVLYGGAAPPKAPRRFIARIFSTKRIAGRDELVLKSNNNENRIRSIRILDTISPLSGEHATSRGYVDANCAASAEILLSSRVPLEPFESCMELGRFALYANSRLAGIGIVERSCG